MTGLEEKAKTSNLKSVPALMTILARLLIANRVRVTVTTNLDDALSQFQEGVLDFEETEKTDD